MRDVRGADGAAIMSSLLPIQASADASQIDGVITLVHALMLVLFVGWTAYFAWVLVRFRQRRQPRANPEGARGRFAFWTEVAVVVAEAALLVIFALPLWFKRTSAQPVGANPVTIRIVAEQFSWNVHYPGADGRFGETTLALVSPDNPLGLNRRSPFAADDVVEINQVHLPINRPAIVQLSSKDVIHSFGVPAMRVKRDAIPGLFSPVWFTPSLPGTFEIACSQLCGLAHFRMRGTIVVESEAAFEKFLADEAAAQRIR
jgi:cytochrome c oxidase subunit 2